MILIVCVDDAWGLLFGGRRQSMDSVLRSQVLQMSAESRLWMNGYSAEQFSGEDISVSEDFLDRAGPGEFCFVENTDVIPYMAQAEKLIIYRWNRRYPSDVKLDLSLLEGWKKESSLDFPGHSHERITREVYTR